MKFSHNVQMSTKSRKIRGSPNLQVEGGSHPPKFFFSKMRFFQWAFEKTYFRRRKNWGVTPTPQFFFLENSLFGHKCFSLRSDYFLSEKYEFFQKWGFSGFLPHRHISAVFELRSTKFWGPVALPEAFPKVSKCVDQSSSVSIKWGFYVFCTHIALSLGNVRFFRRAMPQISGVSR